MNRVQQFAAFLGVTEGQVYTAAVGIVVGVSLLVASLPNLHRGPADPARSALAAAAPAALPTTTVPSADGTGPGTTVPTPVPLTGSEVPSGAPSTGAPPLGLLLPSPDRDDAGTFGVTFLVDERTVLGADDPAAALDQMERTIQSLVDEHNDRGGVAGRSLRADVVTFDGADADARADACRAATEGGRSSVVVGYGTVDVRCVAGEAGVPYLGHEAISARAHRDTAGRAFTWAMSADRLLAEQVRHLDAAGELEDATIGVVFDGWGTGRDAVEDTLVPALEGRGHDVAAAYQFDGDESQADLALATVSMAAAGVDLVFLAGASERSLAWVTAADAVGWRPTHVLSDVGRGVLADLDYPAGFVGIGHSATAGPHERNSGLGPGPIPPAVDACAARHRERTGLDLVPPGSSATPGEVVAWTTAVLPCRDLSLLVEAMKTSESEPEAGALVGVLEGMGALDRWVTPVPAGFAAGKHDAVGATRPVVWEPVCPAARGSGCWAVAGSFTPAEEGSWNH